MREIKFRAWDKWTKHMIHPYNGDFIMWHAPSNWKECYEVMQFTGLHDKNGKEIYEGDVVRYEFGERKFCQGVVEYSKNGFWLRNGYIPYESEVIGNIYENPELLNGE